jgi:von Willebrand factor type A domain
MRSPQLGQKIVSLKVFPLASVGGNGYHLRPMDARAWTVRLVVGVGLAVAIAPAARAQTPTPTATPSGAPKILLAFDASGSMLTDDGNGTRKIDAAKDAAVALLSSLPDSTEIGLRVYGGTLPSRPIGPACRDSKLVLPLGRIDRGQAEEQIRSFRARGRTPIAYALEQAAVDLGDSGSRTIVLVSDGKDTCQPPAPCEVAQEIAKGGVEMRIQAIGFNVDAESRKELQCIASAGGGVYRDATDADSLREELKVLSTRALREYTPKGKPIKGGPDARHATPITPGQYTDQMLPDSERWYAVDLKRGETLKASQSFIPPQRDVEMTGVSSQFDIVTPAFDIPDEQNSSAGNTSLFERRGYVDGVGVVSRPIGVGDQADADAAFAKPGRYYLKLSFEDNDSKDLYNATGGQPYTSEMAVEILGRGRGERPNKQGDEKLPEATITPQEPPSTPLLAAVGGGLAAFGFAAGALLLWRRRA